MKNSHTNEMKFIVLLVLSGIFLGFVPAGHAQQVQEWSDPINLSMSGSASNPSVVVDNNGTLHIIWVDQIDGFKYVQSADGVTWTAPETVRFPFSLDAAPPLLLSDPRGIIHIFWLDEQNKLFYGQALNDTLAIPAGWRRRVNIDSQVFDYDVGLDEQGGVHVAYIKNPSPNPGNAGVFYRDSSDGGLNWTRSSLLYASAYFRAVTTENAHIRIVVSDKSEGEESVYVVWDDRIQKRVYFATSTDGGENWGAVRELVAPEGSQGQRYPYNANIEVLDEKVLTTWVVGEPGGGCTPFSWFSSDGGETWGEPVPVLSGSAQCPDNSEFISIDANYSALLFSNQNDLSLSFWNGEIWSNPQVQTALSSITNPATFDTILLGCKQAVINNGRLYIVGCDEGTGGDIWFIERPLGVLDDLFPLPTKWSGDVNVTAIPRRLYSLSSVTDNAGNVHAVWIQSNYLPTDTFVPRVEYSRWNGSEWTRPSPIITNLAASSQSVTLQIDQQQRLLLSWVNAQTGELMFTWSNSEQANSPLEWSIPTAISSSSRLASSPFMLVDGANRLVLAYAVTLNEERGIYIIQSIDMGESWSTPIKVFDAVSEGWEMVDHPKLAVTEDGALHIVFNRYALSGGTNPIGLYYSRSEDGGTTWIPAETVSEQPVQWSEIVAHQGMLHRLWQESNRLVASTNHQTSLDGGLTWNSSVRIPGDADLNSQPSVTVDPAGNIHFLQVIKQENHVFQEWVWAGERWQLMDSRIVSSGDLNSPAIVESGLTANGIIYSLLRLEVLLTDGIETSLLSIRKSLSLTGENSPALAVISTPSNSPTSTLIPDLQPTTIATGESPLVGLSSPQPGVNRNLVGLILIVGVVMFILFVTLPRRSKTTK